MTLAQQPAPRAALRPRHARHRPAHRRRNETGAAFFSVILLTALLFSLGVFGARSAQIELAIAGNDLQTKRALQAAEAGLSHALSVLRQPDVTGQNEAADGFNDELSGGGTGGGLATIGSTVSLDGETFRFRQYGALASADGYYVHAEDNTDESNGLNDDTVDRDRRIRIISRGRIGGADRTIEATIASDAAPACVLCGKYDFPLLPVLDVMMVGALRSDSYNSSNGPYVAGTAGNNGHIQSNGDISMVTDILGLLPINVRGNVTASRTVVQVGAVNVTGNTTQFAPPVDYPSSLPCGPPYPANDGITGGLYVRSLGTLVNVGVNDVIDLAPGDYCFSSIVMAGLSSLRVTGPTRIFLTAPSVILGVVNTTSIPSNLQIISSVKSPIPLPVIPGLVIGGVAQAHMLIDAPDSIVTFAGLTDFYGSAIAAMLPDIGIGRLHYDDALLAPAVRVSGWRELRNVVPD
jgi:hypothetical protein